MVTIQDLYKLLEVYDEVPPWLPIPEGAPLPLNDTHQRYQEAYSIGVQVSISKGEILKTLCRYQNGIGLERVKEYHKWEGSPDIIPEMVPTGDLDPYSQKVLRVLGLMNSNR